MIHVATHFKPPTPSVQKSWLLLLVFYGVCAIAAPAQATPPPPKQGAALLKTDILGVFAHPDDETGVAGTLAFYALGQTSVVANVYCTRGEGGGNMVGTQSGAALGALREAELRDCLSTLGVRVLLLSRPTRLGLHRKPRSNAGKVGQGTNARETRPAGPRVASRNHRHHESRAHARPARPSSGRRRARYGSVHCRSRSKSVSTPAHQGRR